MVDVGVKSVDLGYACREIGCEAKGIVGVGVSVVLRRRETSGNPYLHNFAVADVGMPCQTRKEAVALLGELCRTEYKRGSRSRCIYGPGSPTSCSRQC